MSEQLRRRLAPYFRVEQLPFADCPATLYVAVPLSGETLGPGRAPTSGIGRSPARALAACLGEAAETLSVAYRAKSPAPICADAQPAQPLPMAQLFAFSAGQLAGTAPADPRCQRFEPVALPSAGGAQRRAVPFTGTHPVCLPRAACELYHPGAPPGLVDSNGCAAGASLEAAIVAGFLELVERDATGIWWYGRHRRPRLDPALLACPWLPRVSRWLQARGRRLRLVDISTDLPVPVVAAWTAAADGSQVLAGFAARLSMAAAAADAVTELLGLELSAAALAPRLRDGERGGDLARLATWFEAVSVSHCPWLEPGPAAAGVAAGQSHLHAGDGRGAHAMCLAIAKAAGLQVWYVDMTSPALGVPVVRVLAPALAHYRPRFACARLYTVPAKLGWPRPPDGEQDLNPIPLFL